MEERGTLKNLTAQIRAIETEIVAINAEMEASEQRRKAKLNAKEIPMIGGLKEWFSLYGEPGEIAKQMGLPASSFPTQKCTQAQSNTSLSRAWQ